MDIQDLLSAFTNGGGIDALSQNSGAKPSQVSNLIKSALPLLLSGMQDNASTQSGAESLANALDQHADVNAGSLNIGSLLNGVDANDGQKILGHILGNQTQNVQSGLSKKTGLSSTQTMGILAMVAPLLLKFLGGQKKQNNVSSGGILDMLTGITGGNSGGLSSMLSSLLADNDGNGTPDILDKLKGLFGFGRK